MASDKQWPTEGLTRQELEQILKNLPLTGSSSRRFVSRVMHDIEQRAHGDGGEYDLDAVFELSRKTGLAHDFTMAFQPIVDVSRQIVVAHEALVRGPNNEPAGQILRQVNANNICLFEELCRIKAVRLAAELGMSTDLSINFPPTAFRLPDNTITATIQAAERFGFPLDRLIFEISRGQGQPAADYERLQEIVGHYKARGFRTAFDDFGPGYNGLEYFGNCQTDMVKLEMAIVRDIDKDRSRQALVRELLAACRDLSFRPVAKGVETFEEFDTLRELGVELFQGYYFAKPAFQSLAMVPSSAYR